MEIEPDIGMESLKLEGLVMLMEACGNQNCWERCSLFPLEVCLPGYMVQHADKRLPGLVVASEQPTARGSFITVVQGQGGFIGSEWNWVLTWVIHPS